MYRWAIALGLLVPACGEGSNEQDAGPPLDCCVGNGDAGVAPMPDAASLDHTTVPPLSSREDPACVPLGEPGGQEPLTDFFATCGHGEPLADRGYTWTALETGFYSFLLFPDYEARSYLELRPGDCTLSNGEEDPAPTESPICAELRPDEDGGHLEHTLLVESGQTITIVAEGDDYYEHPDYDSIQRQDLTPLVIQRGCPMADELREGVMRRSIVSLPSGSPASAELIIPSSAPELRPGSCWTAGPARQVGVSWTAASTGRYRFSAQSTTDSESELAISLIADDCFGAEIGCALGDASSTLQAELDADQVVVLLISDEVHPEEGSQVLVEITEASQ